MFAQATGTKFVVVPYRGASQVLTDMAAGNISLLFTAIASAKPLVDAGTLRALAVAAPRRTGAMPELPTFAELGLPQVDAPLWIGVMAPNGTPAPVITKLNGLFLEALASPSVQTILASVGAEILALGPDAFAAMLRDDYPRWADVVRRGNITVE